MSGEEAEQPSRAGHHKVIAGQGRTGRRSRLTSALQALENEGDDDLLREERPYRPVSLPGLAVSARGSTSSVAMHNGQLATVHRPLTEPRSRCVLERRRR